MAKGEDHIMKGIKMTAPKGLLTPIKVNASMDLTAPAWAMKLLPQIMAVANSSKKPKRFLFFIICNYSTNRPFPQAKSAGELATIRCQVSGVRL